MRGESGSIETLREIIDREEERHPHNTALLEAFRPLILGRRRILEELPSGKVNPIAFDEARFRSGVPVMMQQDLFWEDDPWKEVVRVVIPAIKEGFPDVSDDLSRMEGSLEEGNMALYDYFKSHQNDSDEVLAGWAESLCVSASLLDFVLHQVARVILEKRAASLAILLKDIPWEKGYCPICGAFPALAVIKETRGERLLHCSCCGHDWRFSRVICPYCEHEGQKEMDFFFVEDNAQESAYTCDQCQHYLITLNRMSDLNERDLDVSAIGLVHLDILMQEKKLSPMTVTGWNAF